VLKQASTTCLCLLTWALLYPAATAWAQALTALDDTYDVAEGRSFVVEPAGVLENDEQAGEDLQPTAVAQLVEDAGVGTLALAPDGSFSYTPAVGFLGTDSFTYRVVDGPLTSNIATVELDVRGCEGTLPLLTCWVETEFVAELQALGYATFTEGFEETSVWPLSPVTSPSVTSLGITWSSTYALGDITTGSGAAHTGARGMFALPHGDPSGAAFDPQRDGWTGAAAGTLVGVGGWLDSNTGGARVEFVLDSPPAAPLIVGFTDPVVGYAQKFFGVIDTRGFSGFQIAETEGVVEDQKFIFGDDFTFALVDAPACGDGIDNDGDGLTDFPLDPGCRGVASSAEDPQCQDGVDNDGDGGIDFDGTPPDAQCSVPWRRTESRARRCGLGFEVALLLPGLLWLRRRSLGRR